MPTAREIAAAMPRKRVLHIATRFLDGGSERRIGDIVRALGDAEYEHHFVVGAEHEAGFVAKRLGDRKFTVEKRLVRKVSPIDDTVALGRLAGFIRSGRFDIVHTCQSKAGIIGRLAARAAGTPRIVHSLTMDNFFEATGGSVSHVFRNAERLVGRWTDAYMVVGSDLKSRYVASGIGTQSKYHVIRSSVELARFRTASSLDRGEARNTLGLPNGEVVVGYIGSLQERKGVLHLPAFLKRLQAANPTRLLIAGSGPLEDRLKAEFGAAGLLPNVTFLGFRDDVPLVIAASDCTVLLSEAEGLPQVLVQSAAVGRPFISYPVDGAEELLSMGAQGRVVKERSPIAAAEQALALLQSTSQAREVDLSEWDAVRIDEEYRRLFSRHLFPSPVSALDPARRLTATTGGTDA